MKAQFRVIIPAAGQGSRSGLNYPKSLHPVGGIPILVRLFRILTAYDDTPVLVINSTFHDLFKSTLSQYGFKAEFVFQDMPSGMGHALLQADPCINEETEIILAWSDIALLSPLTVHHLVNCHLMAENTFSLVTALSNNCYTIVRREKGALKAVIETRAEGISPLEWGERDIGLFVFKNRPVFQILENLPFYSEKTGKKELGFLYVIEHLVRTGEKCEAYPIALDTDVLSFNDPEDLVEIEQKGRSSGLFNTK